MKKVLGLLILTSIFCVSAFAQEIKNNSNQTNEWVRLNFDNGEFSFEVPSNFTYFYDKNGFQLTRSSGFSSKTYQYEQMRMFNASAEKTVMRVEIYEVDSPKQYLDELIEDQKPRTAEISETSESMEGFKIKKLEQQTAKDFRNKKDVKISYVTKFIASKKYLYVLTAINRGTKTKAFERFFSAISLSSAQTSSTKDAKIVDISSLTPTTIEQMGEVIEQNKDTKPAAISNQQIEKIENPILFLSKPKASYTEAARRAGNKGIIRLRLKFAENGAISKIGVLSSLPNGLLRNAVFSALRIKFIPQEKDNELISTTNVVEYSFDIY